MSTETIEPVLASVYPRPKLAITATYPEPSAEHAVLDGMPQRVEIEMGDELPDDLAAFIADVVATLFRVAPAGVTPDVVVDPAEQPQGEQPRAEVAA